jgi:septum formation protein
VSDPAAAPSPPPRLVLASGSPRRQELLARLGLEFDVVPPDVDESLRRGERPVEYVRRLAIEKAEKVERAAAAAGVVAGGAVVLAADTTVDVDGRIFGKPADADEARAMLQALSARTHRVHTGVAVRRGSATVHDVVTSLVTFAPLSSATIEWYVGTGEPLDKAGAYAIQGEGAVLVAGVRGSTTNVVGLPLGAVVALLRDVLPEVVLDPVSDPGSDNVPDVTPDVTPDIGDRSHVDRSRVDR